MWCGANSAPARETTSGNLYNNFSNSVVSQSFGGFSLTEIFSAFAFSIMEFALAYEYCRYTPESPSVETDLSISKTISPPIDWRRIMYFIAPIATDSSPFTFSFTISIRLSAVITSPVRELILPVGKRSMP